MKVRLVLVTFVMLNFLILPSAVPDSTPTDAQCINAWNQNEAHEYCGRGWEGGSKAWVVNLTTINVFGNQSLEKCTVKVDCFAQGFLYTCGMNCDQLVATSKWKANTFHGSLDEVKSLKSCSNGNGVQGVLKVSC